MINNISDETNILINKKEQHIKDLIGCSFILILIIIFFVYLLIINYKQTNLMIELMDFL